MQTVWSNVTVSLYLLNLSKVDERTLTPVCRLKCLENAVNGSEVAVVSDQGEVYFILSHRKPFLDSRSLHSTPKQCHINPCIH